MAALEIQHVEGQLVLFQKTYKSEPQRTEIRECLREMKSYPGGDPKCFIREHTMFVETLISLLGCSRVPFAVVEQVYACLVADMFAQEHVLAIISQIGKQPWSSQARMRILQMSFYFIRFDLYTGGEAFGLLRFIIECLDPSDPNVDSAARPIAVLLVEKILKRAVVGRKSYCDMDLETLKGQLCEGRERAAGEDGGTDAEADGAPMKHSRSYEALKEAGPQRSEDLLDLLGSVYTQIHGRSNYHLGFILSSVIKHPGILTVPGMEEFVRSKFFVVCHDVLKHGKPEDKEPMYDSVLKIQKLYESKFAAGLEEFYSRLLRYYGDRGDGFLRFVQNLFVAVLSRKGDGFAHVPAQLYDVFNRTLEDVNLGRKADCRKFQFLESTLSLLRDSTEFYSDAMDRILLKIQNTREVCVPVDSFIDSSLKTVARSGQRDLFDRLLSICAVGPMLDAALDLRWFMRDSWAVVMKRSTHAQRASVVAKHLCSFELDELEFFIRHTEEDEAESVFESALDLLVRPTHLKVFEGLIRKVTRLDVLSAILVRFYSHTQNTMHQHARRQGTVCRGADHPEGTDGCAQQFDPDTLSAVSDREAVFAVPTSPLGILKTHVENSQQGYRKALSCLSDILRIIDPSGCWEMVFAIIDVCRDSIDDQVPILLNITENFINSLEDRFVIKILNILKRMSSSQDNSTCLNALFIYQEVGEFLITNSILEGGCSRAPAAKRMGMPESARSIKIWRDFVILGAVIMKDTRVFMPLSIIRYIMSFIKAEYAFFDDNDFKFIEKIVFEQFLKISDQEVSLFVLDEMNGYIKNYSLRDFTGRYVSHLSRLVCEGDSLKAEKAFRGLRLLVLGVYEETNLVVCGSPDAGDPPQECAGGSAPETDNASRKPFLDAGLHPQGTARGPENRKFVIRSKRTHPLRPEINAMFVSLLQDFTRRQNRLLKDVLQILVLFPYDLREIHEFIGIFYALLRADTSSAPEVADCIERMCFVSGAGDVALVAFAKWLNDENISGLLFNEGKTPVFELLLFKIGEIMNRQGWGDCSGTVLQSLLAFVRDSNADQTMDCVVRACANITESEHLDTFVRFSYSLFTTNISFVESRRRERKFLEFISFYHSSLQAYCRKEGGTTDGRGACSVRKAYDLVLYLTTKSYRNLRLKSYQILFSDIARCQDVLVARLRALLRDYVRDFRSSGEAIENIRVIETVYCLRCVVALNDRAVIDMLKSEMAELLVCGDFDILDSVRKCLRILFA